MADKKLFLFDAFALIYRSHFAFINSPRITSKGLNTSALYGYVNTLIEIIAKENPSHMAVVFDTKAPTFRHVEYPEYKAHREKQPEDITTAIPYAHKLLDTLNIKRLEMDGFEADDLIGTLSHQAEKQGFEVYMVTPDKDYAQLVTDKVFFYKPRSRGGGYDVMGPAQIEEKFGLPPSQIMDFLGLKGDASDNIPGIPRIGDKTAVTLLREFGSVENIVASADKISKKSIRESVEQYGEQGLLSKHLATIVTDVPVSFDPDGFALRHANLEELMKLMAELEFKTTTQRILNSKLNPMRGGQTDLFSGTGTEIREMDIPSGHQRMEDREADYTMLSTRHKRKALIAAAEKGKLLCFDTETTGLDPLQVDLVGIAFSTKAGTGSFLHFAKEKKREEVIAFLEEFRPLFENEKILKIGHNLKYDLLVLRNYGVEVKGPFFDTMLAHYILHPEGKHKMDALAEKYLDYSPVPIEELIGKKGKNQITMHEVETDKLVKYACEDADITLQLYEKLSTEVEDNAVFNDIEQPLMPVLLDMESEGIRVDEKALAEYSIELGERLVILEREIYELAGEKFNINSPKQLGLILFEKLGLGKGQKQKRTKTGQYVTNEQELTALAVHNELPAKILAFRGITKLKSTYVDSLPKMINPNTGRVHSSFNQTVAVTGRLSSDKPNLQNIPIRTADGREVRKGFIPRSSDYKLLSADYSQVELRIMASLSGDKKMCEAFLNKEDIHRATAARVFGVDLDEVSSSQRSAAKMVNFGIIYGISAFGLSQRMGISRTEAKDIIDTYFDQYPGVKAYMDAMIQSAREQGYSVTHHGRRRYLADINSRNATQRSFAERNAINSPIQGTAADIIKLAMISLQAAMKKKKLKSRLLLQVHDELVCDVHLDELTILSDLVETHMVGASDLDIPMEVEIGIGDNWLEAH